MNIARLDGLLLGRMLENGLNNLRNHEDEINKLNVFPVADGDTGTNMRLTLENGIKYAGKNAEIGTYLCSLSNGMLLGARGNSGVILSQLFKGIYEELSRASTIDAGDLRDGFIRGYRVAYNSVVRPVEGTILTVAREGIENIRRQIGRRTTIENMLSMYVAEMKKTLSYTPEMLDVLKTAGVVDSGAMGYITIVDGMLKFLYGEKIGVLKQTAAEEHEHHETAAPNLDHFNENSAFIDGYCMEFLLQLMAQPGYLQNYNQNEFNDTMLLFGESLVAIRDGMRVKVHVHTKTPEKIIAFARQYGEFLTFKLENMQLQHNERDELVNDQKEKAPLAVISAVDGDGLKDLFASLGCAYVIDGGATMNTSAEEFLSAMDSVSADRIVVLPNNKNSIGAANQARSLYKGGADVTVLESKSMVEAYYALAMDVADSTDLDYRVSQMQSGIDGNHTLSAAVASKDYSLGEVSIKTGDSIAMLDGEIVAGNTDMLSAVMAGMKEMPDIDEKSVCIVFRGDGVTEETESELESAINDAYPDLEVSFIDGGQHIYNWLIGLI